MSYILKVRGLIKGLRNAGKGNIYTGSKDHGHIAATHTDAHYAQ